MTETTNIAEVQEQATTVNAENVTTKTICVAVKRGKFGNRRKASTAAVTVQSDKALLSLSKRLLESPELKAVAALDNEVSAYLSTMCLRSLFKGGVYLLPIGLVEEVDAALQLFEARRLELVNACVGTYLERVAETQKRLDVLSNDRDYPTVDQFRATFYMEHSYITFDTPARLKAINPAIFAAERAKAEAKLAAVADDCRHAMRAGMQELIDRMVERLTPGDDGKPKKFHKTMVENFNEFLRTFELRNITDDAELAAVADKARGLLAGVNPDVLRSDDLVRRNVHEGFAAIGQQLTTMTRSSRQIDFDDEN
jgi:hypothetical protein